MYPVLNTEAKKIYPYLALFPSFNARRPNKEGVLLKEYSDGLRHRRGIDDIKLGHWEKRSTVVVLLTPTPLMSINRRRTANAPLAFSFSRH